MSNTALKTYARLCREIEAQTKAIGDALDRCPGVSGKRFASMLVSSSDHDPDDPTHLSALYGSGYSEFVAEARTAVKACPHCSEAHAAVMKRKALRRSLGAVKGALRKAGDRLLAADGG